MDTAEAIVSQFYQDAQFLQISGILALTRNNLGLYFSFQLYQ